MPLYPRIEECKIITPVEYLDLKDPHFEGQTRVDDEGMYYMTWSSEGVLYATHNHI